MDPIIRISRKLKFFPVTLILVFLFCITSSAQTKSTYEKLHVVKASSLLPAKILKGPYHQVDRDVVTYNGITYHFKIKSKWGTFKAIGNDRVYERIREIDAIAKLVEVQNTEAFKNGVVETGKEDVGSVKALLMHPVDTVSGYPEGLGNIFSDFGEGVKQMVKTGEVAEASKTFGKAVTGFTRRKRELAYDLGVDVYSDNKVLQENLNRVCWGATTSGFGIDIVKTAATGGAGVFLTVTSANATVSRMVKEETKLGLLRISRETLEKAGLNESVVESFLQQPELTPRHKITIAFALASLKQAKGREIFLNQAVRTARSREFADTFQAIAEMMEAYNKRVSPIKNIFRARRATGFINGKGAAVLVFPADTIVWTPVVEKKLEEVTEGFPKHNGMEFWMPGEMTALSAKNFQEKGWVVHPHAYKALKMGISY